jgi:outer membrane protein TolC
MLGLLCCLSLVGCANFSADGGFAPVAGAARAELALDVTWPRTADERAKRDREVAQILAQPLTVDAAVQVALLQNHELQSAFDGLGVSEADLVQSGRLPNPRFTLRRSAGAEFLDLEETLTFNVVGILAQPYRHALEKRRFAQAQDALIVRIVQVADRTRTAYYTALAARDSLRYAGQVKEAADLGDELAQRMRSAGNWNRLDQARERDLQLDALARLTQARFAVEASMADLQRCLGTSAPGGLQLAEHLPELPSAFVEAPDGRPLLERRVDLRMGRARLDELSHRLKLVGATRWLDVLDLGPTRVRNGPPPAPVESGFEVGFEVPLFDSGKARVRRAESLYAAAVEDYAQAVADARAQLAIDAARYRSAFDLAALHRDQVLPNLKIIADQDLLRYDASLVGVFELLADARVRIGGINDYIERVRDFWIAKSHLDAALIANP